VSRERGYEEWSCTMRHRPSTRRTSNDVGPRDVTESRPPTRRASLYSAIRFATSGATVPYQLINLAITPLTGIMTALLYLKTRYAGGESLREAAERLAGVDIPRTRWELRMREGYTRMGSEPVSTSPTAPE